MVDRRRRENPKTERLFVRLTSIQLELLRRYIDHREFESEAAGVRAMIDGLEDWFLRQKAKKRELATQPQGVAAHSGLRGAPPHSGLHEDTDVEATDVEATDVEASVGDFAGIPAVRLPESRHDGND